MRKYFYILSYLFFFMCIVCCSKDNTTKPTEDTTTSSSKADRLHTYYTEAIRVLKPTPKAIKRIDSFIQIVQEQQLDNLVYKSYMIKTRLLAKQGNQVEAITDTKELLKLATKNNDSSYIGKANYKLGLYQETLFNYDKAFNYYNSSFIIHRNLKDSLLSVKRLLSMSRTQRILGDYTASNITATDGLKYLTNAVDLHTKLGLYQEISISFREQKNYREALLWNDKIIQLINTSENAKSKIKYMNTRANILRDFERYEQSLDIFMNLLKNPLVVSDSLTYARIVSNYGYCKWKENKDNIESEKLLLNALSLRDSKQEHVELIASHLHLANYYTAEYPEKAIFHANEAYKNAKRINNKVEVLAVLDLITSIDPTALIELQEYKTISKSLDETRKKIRQIYAPTRFENEKLTAETAKKEQQIKTEKANKKKTILWIISIAILIILATVFYYLQRYKTQKERNKAEKLQATISTKKEISKTIHDSIANDLLFIKMLVANKEDEFKILEKLTIVYNKARDISRENNDIDFQKYKEHLKEIINTYISENVNIFEKGIDTIIWNEVSKSKKIIVYQVVKELMVNMHKHSKASIVSVIFKKEKKKLAITYTDNGIGFSINHIKRKNGLSIMENLIEGFNGTINFDSNRSNGIKINIKIPYYS